MIVSSTLSFTIKSLTSIVSRSNFLATDFVCCQLKPVSVDAEDEEEDSCCLAAFLNVRPLLLPPDDFDPFCPIEMILFVCQVVVVVVLIVSTQSSGNDYNLIHNELVHIYEK